MFRLFPGVASGDRGQILIETSVVFPVAMFLVYAIFQTAVVIVTALVVNYAAYVGARAGVVHVQDAQYETKAIKAVRLVLTGLSVPRALLAKVTVTLERTRLTVRVTYPTPWLLKVHWIPLRFLSARCSLVPETYAY